VLSVTFNVDGEPGDEEGTFCNPAHPSASGSLPSGQVVCAWSADGNNAMAATTASQLSRTQEKGLRIDERNLMFQILR
jgi:hypothetical protein